jgi:hypothetical protein
VARYLSEPGYLIENARSRFLTGSVWKILFRIRNKNQQINTEFCVLCEAAFAGRQVNSVGKR